MTFLAGGITGCPDWQQDATALLAPYDVIVLNPRRASYDGSDPDAADMQVRWEYTHRRHPALAAILFWFPPSAMTQPIALLELGEMFARPAVPIVVGADPGYVRRTDVVLQCRYARPEVTIHSTLVDTVAALITTMGWCRASEETR
ncbi:hypothetical protein FDG2_5489 [Candidatus Protofrankia californiensis]|uniref:Nucleoside 2-deoxyribosyltransferase n=1 Tax=Candidatus Protofrankia californiensis TaxID=1839754 RepID=A0A1C3PDU5_9ACTN|nr:hypothetical protein FDG2_5489 [Candidatus Protofrankia californiensis]